MSILMIAGALEGRRMVNWRLTINVFLQASRPWPNSCMKETSNLEFIPHGRIGMKIENTTIKKFLSIKEQLHMWRICRIPRIWKNWCLDIRRMENRFIKDGWLWRSFLLCVRISRNVEMAQSYRKVWPKKKSIFNSLRKNASTIFFDLFFPSTMKKTDFVFV